jgi:hypothetical protein
VHAARSPPTLAEVVINAMKGRGIKVHGVFLVAYAGLIQSARMSWLPLADTNRQGSQLGLYREHEVSASSSPRSDSQQYSVGSALSGTMGHDCDKNHTSQCVLSPAKYPSSSLGVRICVLCILNLILLTRSGRYNRVQTSDFP